MADLIPTPGWDAVPLLETTTRAVGGVGGVMNAQAQALLNRIELLRSDQSAIVTDVAALRVYTGELSVVNLSSTPGEFRYDPLDTTSTDNNGTVIVDALARRWKRIYDGDIDVTWFGTIGDGVANDTSLIQAAINEAAIVGAPVFIPAGIYLIDELIVDSPGISIRGVGLNTVLVPSGLGASDFLIHVSASGVTVSQLHIDADRTDNPDLICIAVESADTVCVKEILLTKSGSIGVLVDDSQRVRIEQVFSYQSQTRGIKIINSTECEVVDCVVQHVHSGHGIQLEESTRCVVSNCQTENVNQVGIQLFRSNGCKVVNHRGVDSRLEGVNIMDGSRNEIINPLLTWTSTPTWPGSSFGILIDSVTSTAAHNKIVGGVVQNSAKSGIALSASVEFTSVSDVTVIDPNRINETHGSAILLFGLGVKNNHINSITAICSDTAMRHGANEFNSGGLPTLNKFVGVVTAGTIISAVNCGPTSSHLTVTDTTITTNKAIRTTSAEGGIGFDIGAGGIAAQTTSKNTAVTINRPSGQITMHAAALPGGATVVFTVNNSTVAATDLVIVKRATGGTDASYWVDVDRISNGSFSILVNNSTNGSLAQALVLNFVVIKGATS